MQLAIDGQQRRFRACVDSRTIPTGSVDLKELHRPLPLWGILPSLGPAFQMLGKLQKSLLESKLGPFQLL